MAQESMSQESMSQESVSRERTLSDLAIGQTGVILKVRGTGSVRRRIIDMGMTRGSRVEIVRKAPMGDPIEFRIKGYNLSLRKSEADLILIEPEEG